MEPGGSQRVPILTESRGGELAEVPARVSWPTSFLIRTRTDSSEAAWQVEPAQAPGSAGWIDAVLLYSGESDGDFAMGILMRKNRAGSPAQLRVRRSHAASRFASVFVLSCLLTPAASRSLFGEPADRRVAEWALRTGGTVVLAGKGEPIGSVNQLPGGDFKLEILNLVGTNMKPPDLARLSQLRHLEELHLPQPMWIRHPGLDDNQNPQMRHLASLSSLRRLTFSYFFREFNGRFKDEGIEQIAALTNLEEFRVRRAAVRGHSLGPFRNLKSLDLTYCRLDDEGMRNIENMKALQKLWIGDTRVTDEGLAYVRDLHDLEELHLQGNQVSDAGLVHLEGLVELKTLNLRSAGISDHGLQRLARLTKLEVLNLYNTKVSNAGLQRLARLKRLREVDLRYSRVTRAGVEALQVVLPGTRLLFLDVSPRNPEISAVRFPADGSEEAIARWVRSMGGEAEIVSGALREVSLARTAVTDRHLEKFRGLPNLRRLSLAATEAGDLGVRCLEHLPGITELDLTSTLISDAGLQRLKGLRGLRNLRLDQTVIEGPGLEHIRGLQQLEDLSVVGAPVGDIGLPPLAGLKSLTRLWVAETDITDEGASALADLRALTLLDVAATDLTNKGLVHLKGLTGLRWLSLSYTRFTDEGLVNLEGLTELRQLAMIRTRLGDAGMKSIGKLTKLTDLDLDYTEVTDEGISQITGLRELRTLSLDSTLVTDESVPHLSQLSELEKLNLYHTLISAEGHQKLKTALPECEIVWDPDSALPNRRRS